jgi:hypothetical protein
MAKEAVKHRFESFKATVSLIGAEIEQTVTFSGSKCQDHSDLAAYIAEKARPVINGMTPEEIGSLREIKAQLEAKVQELGAKVTSLEKDLAVAEKAAKTAKNVAARNES